MIIVSCHRIYYVHSSDTSFLLLRNFWNGDIQIRTGTAAVKVPGADQLHHIPSVWQNHVVLRQARSLITYQANSVCIAQYLERGKEVS